MIITIKKNVSQNEIDVLCQDLQNHGVKINYIKGETLDVIGLVGDTTKVDEKQIKANSIVENVTRIAAPYKLTNRLLHPEDTIVDVCGIKVGGNENIVIIGGPCAVESHDSIISMAKIVKECGAVMLRGGAYKPRTSPYAFQGMQTDGLIAMVDAKKVTKLPVVSEIMSGDKLEEFEKYVDLIQVGARNMQNFELLKILGKSTKPILLKRGLANTIEEWIMSAEYIMSSGNPNVILCERGIRTFEKLTRNTLDLSAVPIIKQRCHLPIIVDPSHATGDFSLVESMSLAAIAAGCDGLIIEVHDNPTCAISDGAQSLKPERFKALVIKAKQIAKVIGRDI